MSASGGMRRGAALPLLLGGIAIMLFLALGTWQVRRLAWKRDLIARTDHNIHAPAIAPPPPSTWHRIGQADAYRHVTMRGIFDHPAETLVQAVTAHGAGFWVMTPLRQGDGRTILVNRGFVPADHAVPAARTAGQPVGAVTVNGLLRLTEPGGGFLRANDPAHDRWFSRDVAAIGRARHLSGLAPYFIDADAAPNAGGFPIGGLTVVAFADNHLVYAITWYGLAVLTGGGLVAVLRARKRAE